MENNEGLTGAQLLVQCLQNLGVKNSFGVPGESYLAVLDALHDADIQFTLCRQEGDHRVPQLLVQSSQI